MSEAKTDECLTKAAKAIQLEIKRQFNGHPIPGIPEPIDSWTAIGGELDCTELARVALQAAYNTTPTWQEIHGVLDSCLIKLAIMHEQTGGVYGGGVEYTHLRARINSLIDKLPKPPSHGGEGV